MTTLDPTTATYRNTMGDALQTMANSSDSEDEVASRCCSIFWRKRNSKGSRRPLLSPRQSLDPRDPNEPDVESDIQAIILSNETNRDCDLGQASLATSESPITITAPSLIEPMNGQGYYETTADVISGNPEQRSQRRRQAEDKVKTASAKLN